MMVKLGVKLHIAASCLGGGRCEVEHLTKKIHGRTLPHLSIISLSDPKAHGCDTDLLAGPSW